MRRKGKIINYVDYISTVGGLKEQRSKKQTQEIPASILSGIGKRNPPRSLILLKQGILSEQDGAKVRARNATTEMNPSIHSFVLFARSPLFFFCNRFYFPPEKMPPQKKKKKRLKIKMEKRRRYEMTSHDLKTQNPRRNNKLTRMGC